MIFTDTGGWYGMSIPEDPNHAAALGWLWRPFLPPLREVLKEREAAP